MREGWISLHRELLDKPIWKTSNANQKAVLIAILLRANHEPGQWEWCGKPFQVQAGQLICSIQSLADEAGVSKQSVRSALVRFKKFGFINTETNTRQTLITICNYSRYQKKEEKPNTKTSKGPTQGQHRPNTDPTTNNNNNNNINNNNPPKSPQGDGLPEGFDEFWDAYPKRVSKQTAIKAFKRLKPDQELLELIFDDIREREQSEDWRKDGGRYIPHPSTYLNQRRWEDEKPKLQLVKSRGQQILEEQQKMFGIM